MTQQVPVETEILASTPGSTPKPHTLVLPFNRGTVTALEFSDSARLCQQPLVSVVMLTYAHEAYLAKAIEGVIAQKTDFEIELIVGEDCSPDRTLAIAKQFQAKHPAIVRVITGERNVRARFNSYRCERLCRGKYVAYCEGDDYWHDSGKLQRQVDHLEAHPECGLVYTNADTHEITTGRRTKMAIPCRPELCDSDDPFVQQLTGVRIVWPLTVCVRRTLVEEIARDCPEITDPVPPMGDTQRYLEIAHRSRIDYLPVSTATRNLLPESATRSQSTERRARFVSAGAEIILHYLNKYPVAERYDRQVRRWVHLRELHYAYLCRDRAKARKSCAALRAIRIPVPLMHRLYYFGALSVVAHSLVKGLLAGLDAVGAVKGILRPGRVETRS